MYFPTGWPKTLNLSLPHENANINHICCDAVKILVAAISDDVLSVWYANPLIPITLHQRSATSVSSFGVNRLIVWKPDSRQIAILTSLGIILLYKIDFEPNGNGILMQVDPPSEKLKRESAELFIKENIPCLSLKEVCSCRLDATITVLCCISLTELLIATEQCELLRLLWTDLESWDNNSDQRAAATFSSINLRDIPFYVNQNCHLKSLPPIGNTAYVAALEYSPFIGGCATVFSDNRAAFLIATHLRFESQNMHGFWIPDVDDATVCSVNHKFRLMAYGRHNSDVMVYAIEDATGGLELSHRLSLNSSVIPENLGSVNELRWSPDGCVLAATWDLGGIALWSTFGALLMSSFNWDFGLHVDLVHRNPLIINRLEWSTEGYQLLLTCKSDTTHQQPSCKSNVLQLNFVKSTLATNPCMASQSRVLLQGDDTLYLNQGDNIEKIYFGSEFTFPNNGSRSSRSSHSSSPESIGVEVKKSADTFNILSESKYWTVLQLPLTYAATNWPIRYSAIDTAGLHLAVAGRTGLAHYSMLTRKWKVFGNETQEKDFVVSGGLLYWQDFIVLGCYSLLDRTDEIRCYPEEKKLDNQFGNKIQVRAPIISLNTFQDQLIALTADGIVSLFVMTKCKPHSMNIDCAYEVDVKNICIHPACIVSLTVTNLRNDLASKNCGLSRSSGNESAAETIIVNVSGRILMMQRDPRNNTISSLMATCVASCVECFWTSSNILSSPMHDSLWLYSGANGMRVWLPILPPTNEQVHNGAQRMHTFMSKRIMLSFPLKLYPLVILFDNVIALGVENETTLYCNESRSHFALPFSVLEQKSQVYLHKILRQLIKRNLGYSAWEIAKSCRSLPYFPHSLELLLHEVLEEEATSKEPLPDALLPSILSFIREFPVYLQTVVRCARKTEIALWPYLFSIAGKPKDLFQQCLQSEELDTAASYLIILQNLEPSFISKQYATLLLDVAIKNCKWELAKDLIRFLKAIDPNEIDSPRSSMVVNVKIAPPTQAKPQVNQNAEAFNMILGPIARERSFSVTAMTNLPKEKKTEKHSAVTATATPTVTGTSAPNESTMPMASSSNMPSMMRRKCERSNSTKDRKEVFCIDTILQHHARTLLEKYKLIDLGCMSAFLDFHLVSWLSQEADKAAKLDDFILALKCLHKELNLSTVCPSSLPPDEQGNISDCYSKTEPRDSFDFDNMSYLPQAQSQTSESGYFSLTKLDTPVSTTTCGTVGQSNMSSIKEHESVPHYPLFSQTNCNPQHQQSRSGSQISVDYLPYTRLLSVQEDMSTFAFGLDSVSTSIGSSGKALPEKLAIKIRYLLQLFIEANCIDFALVLSILLKDAASIGRIINGVIRSDSLTVCSRIHAALKRLMVWSLDRECLYHAFMISLRPHICLLEQYIMSSHNTLDGNLNSSRKSTISETCEEVDDSQVKGLCLTQSNLANANPNWALDRLAYDSQGVPLQAHNDNDENLVHSKTRSNSKHSLKEESGKCRVM